MTNTINFYKALDPYGEFSNFYRDAPILLDGKLWPSSEHYYQAIKFTGIKDQEEIRNAPLPRDAARMGRDRDRPGYRKDWDKVKDVVMWKAVLAKFTQHPKLKELLLSTGDATLVEHTKNDSYWGNGGDGSGQNKLGQCLMSVRHWFRTTESRATRRP
jgi:ribA/ribD-fused uncharacterized protein